MSHYAIDSTHSDVFAVWQAEGSPSREQITASQIERIKAHDELEAASPTRQVECTKGGEWSIKLQLEPHGVALLVLQAR